MTTYSNLKKKKKRQAQTPASVRQEKKKKFLQHQSQMYVSWKYIIFDQTPQTEVILVFCGRRLKHVISSHTIRKSH